MPLRPPRVFVEVAVTVVVIASLLLALLAFTGVWPPTVVVESGSMMHPHRDTPYGKLGTIDPGDLVLVKRIDGRDDVRLAMDGGRDRYGASGDVVVYRQNGDPGGRLIIHRAVTWVEVVGEDTDRTFRLWWDGAWHDFGPEGITFPEAGFDERSPCCRDGGWRPLHSGFVTQGDNPLTNGMNDQASLLTPQPVKPEWVRGVARGEIPWLGLIKLALAPGINAYAEGWVRVGNAYAPEDLWVMLGVSVGVFLVAPVGWETFRRRR